MSAREKTKRSVSFEETLKKCEAAIRANPKSAPAHLNRGIVLHAMRRFAEALDSLDRAVALDSSRAESHYHQANTLKAMGRFEESLAAYDRAIALAPGQASVWNNRGNLLRELARLDEAIESYHRALAIQPDLAEAHYNLAESLQRKGRAADAVQSYDRALALRPSFTEAWYKRGNAAQDLNHLDEALRSYQQALAQRPDFAEAWNNRGNLMRKLGRLDDALQSYSRAIASREKYALAYNNRSIVMGAMGRLDRALADCDHALALEPRFPEAHYNRGNILKALKRLPEAIEAFDCAIVQKPDFADAYWNKGVTTLLMGDFQAGLLLHEWRNRKAEQTDPPPSPMWSGQEIKDKTLFVVAEQGLGDTIQFARFAGIAAARGAEVILAVQDRLHRLMNTLTPAIQIVRVSEPHPEFDYSVRLMSMPLNLGTRLQTIPARIPYLRAEQDRVEAWVSRIGSSGFKVGICWQGAPGGEIDIGRSFPVRAFEQLARIPGLRLISLQKGAGSEQLLDLPPGMRVETLGDELDTGADAFVDTAAIIESLDLVISSDTAVAHLAGALGRPVWVALAFVPDWRWLIGRSDTPWYPTMELFRQKERGDWPSVFEQMEPRLRQLAQAGI